MIHPLETTETLTELLESGEALIYKHSPVCGTSARAYRQVRQFVDDHPAVPVYMVDVITHRPLSRRVAEVLGIRHESPQAILVREGVPVWYTSHGRITADALAQQVEVV